MFLISLFQVSEGTREDDTDKDKDEGIGMAGALARALEMRAKVIQDESGTCFNF